MLLSLIKFFICKLRQKVSQIALRLQFNLFLTLYQINLSPSLTGITLNPYDYPILVCKHLYIFYLNNLYKHLQRKAFLSLNSAIPYLYNDVHVDKHLYATSL